MKKSNEKIIAKKNKNRRKLNANEFLNEEKKSLQSLHISFLVKEGECYRVAIAKNYKIIPEAYSQKLLWSIKGLRIISERFFDFYAAAWGRVQLKYLLF